MVYLPFLHHFYIKTSTSCGIYFLKDSCGERYLFPVFESNCGSMQHHIEEKSGGNRGLFSIKSYILGYCACCLIAWL